jgi:SWI/SNF related-matrix-associated actin-dependent regulator of chromatin subfamily C
MPFFSPLCRVHEFLEHSGLINFAIMPDTVGVFPPSLPIPEPTSAAQQLLRLDTSRQTSQRVDVGLVNRSFILSSQPEPVTKKYTCANCKSLCEDTRFHSTKQDDYVLCKNCYAEGKQLPDHQRTDFVQADVKDELVDDSASWTNEETLALLDAIKAYGDQSWDQVAEHVGSKSVQQCIAHFVRLPIEDPYFAVQPFNAKLPQTGGSEEAFPLSGMANPIVALLSFLRDGVAPEVASAAAQAALKTFMEMEKKTAPSSGASSSAAAAGAASDAMDVDGPASSGASKDASAMDVVAEGPKKDAETESDQITRNIRVASAAALAAATLRASLLAEREERDIHRLVYKVVDLQLQKLELKMKYVDELDKVLRDEQAKIEVAHHRLLQDKLSLEESRRANAQKHVEVKANLEAQVAEAENAVAQLPPVGGAAGGISMSQIFPQ